MAQQSRAAVVSTMTVASGASRDRTGDVGPGNPLSASSGRGHVLDNVVEAATHAKLALDGFPD
jgi:hypothetical protein